MDQHKEYKEKEYAESLEELQRNSGFHFNNMNILVEAFVHRSYLNENPGSPLHSNERLEFLGDSIIGFVIAEKLFRELPQLSEGEMTRLRSQIVSQEGLSALARQIDLGKYLLLSRGEGISGGRDRDSNLARTFESLMGAIYLDQGLPAVKDFLNRMVMSQDVVALMTSETFDYKSKLQEYTQAKYQVTPVYETVEEEGPPHDRNFLVIVKAGEKVIGEGKGKSKKKAEEEAAKYALEKMV